ncbi:MAG: hypothetical protein HC800_15400, partial [Phormidesmis sp. RL_2_1]|nr:hypothetical protein [Phormidesmis sp. RL_2_1]
MPNFGVGDYDFKDFELWTAVGGGFDGCPSGDGAIASTPLGLSEAIAQIETDGETDNAGETDGAIEVTEVAEITDVRITSTSAGLTVSLVASGPLSVGESRALGNALITEIPNATLNLADPAAAEQFGPTEGIALVQVNG